MSGHEDEGQAAIMSRARELQALNHYHAPFQTYWAMARQEVDAHQECFDVEAYRTELLRRHKALDDRARDYWGKYLHHGTDLDLADWRRCRQQADGIGIALGLLPMKGKGT
jgi:hypothetical protein